MCPEMEASVFQGLLVEFLVGMETCTCIRAFPFQHNQERIEPVKPAREHATTIDGEIQIWCPDANSNMD